MNCCNDDILLITAPTVLSKYEMSNYQLVLTTHAVNQEAANYQHRYKNVSQHKNSTQKVQKGLGFLPLCPSLTISFMLFECNLYKTLKMAIFI